MIATRLPRTGHSERVGGVQPLSAILPAVLRRYGIQFPPAATVRGLDFATEPCGADDSRPAVCVCGDVCDNKSLTGCSPRHA